MTTQQTTLACDHHLGGDTTGLLCHRTDPHTVGHTYESSTGSWLRDRHDLPGGGDE